MKKVMLSLGVILALSVNSAFAAVSNFYVTNGISLVMEKNISQGELDSNGYFEDLYKFKIQQESESQPFMVKVATNRIYTSLADGSFFNISNVINLNYGVFDSTNTLISNSNNVLSPGDYTLKVSGQVSESLSGAYRFFIGVGQNVNDSFDSIKESFYLPDVDLKLDVGNFPTPAVPEPDTYSTMGLGLAMIGVIAYRRRKIIS